MRRFFAFSLGYLALVVVILSFGEVARLERILDGIGGFGRILTGNLPTVVLLAALVAGLVWWRRDSRLLVEAGWAMGGIFLFNLAFTLFKITMPERVGFFADPALAQLDAWLHFGLDPWRLTHLVLGGVDAGIWSAIYVNLWLAFALGFPLLLALLEPDATRRRHFLILWACAWIGLGNVLANLTMSVGPVYYDALLGGTRFVHLHVALAESGIATSLTGALQGMLWDQHVSGQAALGSGISAFPSVHVGIAAVLTLYVFARTSLISLRALALAVLALFQILSVHLGWHYAVDGYASILLVWGLHRWLARRGSAASPLRQAAALH